MKYCPIRLHLIYLNQTFLLTPGHPPSLHVFGIEVETSACQWDPVTARSSPSLLLSPSGCPAVAVACFRCESLRGAKSRTSAWASGFKRVGIRLSCL